MVCQTPIARKTNLCSRKSFIYKYKTSTLTPFVKPWDILNLATKNVFYIQMYVESAFTNNRGSAILLTLII